MKDKRNFSGDQEPETVNEVSKTEMMGRFLGRLKRHPLIIANMVAIVVLLGVNVWFDLQPQIVPLNTRFKADQKAQKTNPVTNKPASGKNDEGLVDAPDLAKLMTAYSRQPASKDVAPLTQYQEIKTPYVAAIPDYQIQVENLDNLVAFRQNGEEADFSAENLNKLATRHSFALPEEEVFYADDPDDPTDRTDDWVSLYNRYNGDTHECYRELSDSIFITTDFMAHLYHRLLERQMEYLDQEEFAPRLKNLTIMLLAQAQREAAKADAQNQASWQRLEAFLLVGAGLLDQVPVLGAGGLSSADLEAQNDTLERARAVLGGLSANQTALEWASEELERIFEGKQVGTAVIYPDSEKPYDYTQFTPRSYYNKNQVLRSYFRAMMWYGRVNFALKKANLTRDALNLTKILNDQQLMALWNDIYEPTSFLVGVSDDLTFFDYQRFVSDERQVDEALIGQVQAQAESFAKPQIFSEVAISSASEEELLADSLGWRLMGQRFTLDGMIFDRLTGGYASSSPSGITAPMVVAAFGSDLAKNEVQTWLAKNFPESNFADLDQEINKLRQKISTYTTAEWTQNSYWSWLYLHKSLMNEGKNWLGYPKFMSFAEWRKKDLNTIIGSWTELKHDTLLYAKQSYAEMGGGGGEECAIKPVPKGYVEPNIEFYDRLEGLIMMVDEGLEQRGLLHETIAYRAEKLLEAVRFYRSLAVKELANQKISDEEFAQLQASTMGLDSIAGVLSGQQTEKEARSALIADVHTDAFLGEVYYEAVGIPQTMYVAVSDTNGTRLAKGLIFAQYEFTRPLGGETRLTDEQWQEMIYEQKKDELPPLSPWSSGL